MIGSSVACSAEGTPGLQLHFPVKCYLPGYHKIKLLHYSTTKLFAKWQGPFKVTWQMNDEDYEVVPTNRAGARQIYYPNRGDWWRLSHEPGE